MEYADWIGDYYPSGGAKAKADEDPDGDKMKNVLEQLFGRNPMEKNTVNRLEVSIVEDDGQDYLVVDVDRVSARNIRPGIEFSEDPIDPKRWAIDSAMEVLEVMEDGPMRYAVRLPVDLARQALLFARLVENVEG